MCTNIVMVEFDDIMWEAFAGAERGPNGELPRSNEGSKEVLLNGELAIVLADANGVCVMDADGDTQWILPLPNNNIGLAVFIAEHLGVVGFGNVLIETAHLTQLGFTEV